MTDHDKNMRTMIVCFVLLILGLVPLRFVEVGNLMNQSKEKVLGDKTTVEITKVDKVEIVLPNAEVNLGDISE